MEQYHDNPDFDLEFTRVYFQERLKELKRKRRVKHLPAEDALVLLTEVVMHMEPHLRERMKLFVDRALIDS